MHLLVRRPVRYAAALTLAAVLALAPPGPAVPVVPVDATAECAPRPALVDAEATPAARCLAARLDSWRAKRRMAVGQQLNVSNGERTAPLDALGPRPVPVVGFDLEELDQAAHHEYPSDDEVVAELLSLAQESSEGAGDGAVLVASWHARNPHTGAENSFDDRSWHDLGALLRHTPEAAAFWAAYDTVLGYLARLQSGEDGRYSPAAVVFRPLHEANGGWFWWGHPEPKVYRKVWARMQARAAELEVHNIVWGYSANVVNAKTVRKPASLLPGRVDLAGLDAYDYEAGDRAVRRDRLPLAGWGGLARKVKRMALTEVGPYDSTTGRWDPAVVTRTLRQRRIRPVWAMFWFDDLPTNRPRYLRQLSSLRGGPDWLDEQCPTGTCRLR